MKDTQLVLDVLLFPSKSSYHRLLITFASLHFFFAFIHMHLVSSNKIEPGVIREVSA
uniref:Uncharacterized protein n=1 Tax=Kalanchoe fedtschenkoi TaxID=63787 RepID=A0A7N0V6Z3_KALFE